MIVCVGFFEVVLGNVEPPSTNRFGTRAPGPSG